MISKLITLMLIHTSGFKNTFILSLRINAGRYGMLLVSLHLYGFSIAQISPFFYVSNAGNDSFPGTSNIFPKKTIAAIIPSLKKAYSANGFVKLDLKSGDIFEEGLTTSYPIELNTYANNAGHDFAILNGTKIFDTGWIKEPGGNYTFQQSIPYSGFVGYGINAISQYSFMGIFEIDKLLEKTAPFSARKLLKYVNDITKVESNAGSFYMPLGNQNPMPAYIHTSDGSSPDNNNKYRYEVTVRDWAVNSTYQKNNHFENLWVRGFGAGNGMLPGGENSYYNKIIFGPGAGIHHLGLRSGTVNHSLFLPGARNTSQFALVFYDGEGLGWHCSIKNSIFLDIPMPLYAHTSFGTNWGIVEMDNVVGFADSVLVGPFMYTSNTDSVLLNNIYADGYSSGYNYGNASYAGISNSIFKDVQFGIAYNTAFNAIQSKVDNVFIKTAGTNFTSGLIIQDRTILNLHNAIVYVKNANNSAGNSIVGTFISGGGSTKNSIVASRNIFICDVGAGKSLTAATTNTNEGIATSKDSWDYNVYVLLRGNAIEWAVTNAITNEGSYVVRSFDDWKKQSGQDGHSIFFDLRKDPRGLKAIFEDPENGNYDLANTREGSQVAALQAGMTNPVSCFLKRPAYEEAAEMIRNDKAFSVNKCRNPCSQNSIKVNATFRLDTVNSRQVKLKWTISEQENIERYIVQKATANSPFKMLSSIQVSQDSFYTVVDNVQSGIKYRYRLMVIAKSGNKCYSDFKTINFNTDKPFTIYPNPSTGKILISMNGFIGRTSFTISNSTGQVVLVKQGVSLFAPQVLDLSNQPPGAYVVKVETLKGFFVQSFILLK